MSISISYDFKNMLSVRIGTGTHYNTKHIEWEKVLY